MFVIIVAAALANAVLVAFVVTLGAIGTFLAFFLVAVVALFAGTVVAAATAVSLLTLAAIGFTVCCAGCALCLWLAWQCLSTGASATQYTVRRAAAAAGLASASARKQRELFDAGPLKDEPAKAVAVLGSDSSVTAAAESKA
eukprot:SM000069S20715  [mRNA]  locus=s69:391983:392730:- [translate_table: standard]